MRSFFGLVKVSRQRIEQVNRLINQQISDGRLVLRSTPLEKCNLPWTFSRAESDVGSLFL